MANQKVLKSPNLQVHTNLSAGGQALIDSMAKVGKAIPDAAVWTATKMPIIVGGEVADGAKGLWNKWTN